MIHARKQIRDAVVSAVTGLVTTGANVINGQVFATHDAQLPGLAVYARSEEIDPDIGGKDHFQARTLSVTIEANAKAEIGFDKPDSGLDDLLDQILAEVELAIFNSIQLAMLCRCLDFVSFDTEVSKEGENATGTLTMILNVQYLTDKGAPEVII